MTFTAAFTPSTVFAANDTETTAEAEATDNSTAGKAIAAAIAIGLAAGAGALGMGMSISKSVDGIARQPEAEGKIRTTLMLGIIFIETAIIYALIVAILIVFVL
ncbi:MAG: ATP synthase F0 subunit C [Eubacterium sp.]|nr:ATP synthase F0 subunit C [Eubacterium sp.]